MTKLTGKAVLTTKNIDVATYDIDFAGVVSNIVYIRWMEDMRMAMTGPPYNLPLIALMEDGNGVAPAITKTEVHYRRAIRLGDKVIGTAWCSKLTHRQAVMEFEFHIDGTKAAYGRQTGCFINLATKKFARTPMSWMKTYKDTFVLD